MKAAERASESRRNLRKDLTAIEKRVSLLEIASESLDKKNRAEAIRKNQEQA